MNKRLSLYLCYIVITLFAIVLTVNSPLLSYMANTFHLTLAQSGILFTANFVGFACFILIGGILADKLNKKVVVSISLIGLSFSMLIFPLVTNIYVAMAIMLLIGGFGGIIESNINALVAEIYPEKAVFYINMAQVFFGIGALFGPITAGILVSSGISWQACYIGLGILVMLVAFVFSMNKMSNPISDDKITWPAFKALVTDKKFLIICLCMFLYTGSEVGSWGWLSTFLKKNLEFSAVKSSIAVGLFWLAMTVGRFICATLTNRFSTRAIIIVLAAASGIATFLAGAISNQYAVWVFIILMGLTYSSIWPMIVGYGDKLYKNSKGTVFALLIGSGGVGASVIPLFMGFIAQGVNIRLAIMSPAILMFVLGYIFVRAEK